MVIIGPNNNFLGWKRSIATALEIGKSYQYIMHIENDVIVKNFDKVYQYIFKEQMSVGYANPYHMIDTAFMILNDKEKNNILYTEFSKPINISNIIEVFVHSLLQPQIIFSGVRFEEHPERLSQYQHDYIGQAY